MIIESICNLFIKFFTSLLKFVNIPQIPQDVLQQVNETIDTIITRGSELIELVMPYTIARTLLLVVIAIELAIHIYHFVMWVIRKIPMVGMS